MSKEKEQNHVLEGTVQFFSPKKNYGFISIDDSSEDTPDIFVHKKNIAEGNKIKKGDKVTFILVEDKEVNPKGPFASNVKKIEDE